ncbi:hypothetical protein [Cognatilysobacter terrigena]|uniref:hypothetical protein n=1 Tax=Cognatilysobacter terrigena TaxID=2488749 RepID=UPI00105BF9BF|nr:hypothetical protein [Lysobacter terrigena]
MSEQPAGPRLDPAAAEAAAERLMAMHRLQQDADTYATGQSRGVARILIVLIGALVGGVCGAMMGAMRHHTMAGAFLLALVGGMLALVQSRPR